MRLMDLSGFNVTCGDTQERGSKAGTLPVLLPPVLWLDPALSPVPVSMSQLKQMFWGKIALCQRHDLTQPDHQMCVFCAVLALLKHPRNRLIPQCKKQRSNKTPQKHLGISVPACAVGSTCPSKCASWGGRERPS